MVTIHILKCLEDNYGYIIHNESTGEAITIDVPEAAPIEHKISELGATLKAVLLTHHHADHIDGLPDLTSKNHIVFGARQDARRLPKLDVELDVGSTFEVAGIAFKVMNGDGHTIGQIIYYAPELGALFSADSLMTWGCGRLFEGTPAQAFETLDAINKLPADTLIYSGHNYGEMGGKFAMSLGADLETIKVCMDKIKSQNAAGEPIVPVRLSEEQATNPFLQNHNDGYAAKLNIAELSPVERFTHIRKLRDNF